MHPGRRNSQRPFFAVDANAPRLSVLRALGEARPAPFDDRARPPRHNLPERRTPGCDPPSKRSHATAPSCLTSRPSPDGIGNILYSVKSRNRYEEFQVITIILISGIELMRMLTHPAERRCSGIFRNISYGFANKTISKRYSLEETRRNTMTTSQII